MRKPTPLYFDKVNNEGLNGYTNDSDKIYFNLKQIDESYYNAFIDSFSEHGASSITITAGRFILIASMTFDRTKQEMVVMDMKNDEGFAASIWNGLPEDERNKLTTAFYHIRESYEQEFAKFSLVEGSPPTDTK